MKLFKGWTTWDTGHGELPAINVPMLDGTTGCAIVSYEGMAFYRTDLETLAQEDEMEPYFIGLLNGHDMLLEDEMQEHIDFNILVDLEEAFCFYGEKGMIR